MKKIEKSFNTTIKTSIIMSIILILVGLFIFVKPDLISKTVGYILGTLILLSGINSIIRFFTNKSVFFRLELVFGVLSLIGGIIILLNPHSIANFMTIVFGIWIIISALMKLQYALNLKKLKQPYWLVTLGIALLTLFVGVILVINPFSTSMLLTSVVGIFIMLIAGIDLIQTILFKRNKDMLIKVIK